MDELESISQTIEVWELDLDLRFESRHIDQLPLPRIRRSMTSLKHVQRTGTDVIRWDVIAGRAPYVFVV